MSVNGEKVLLVDNVESFGSVICSLLDMCVKTPLSGPAQNKKNTNIAKLRLLRNGKVLYGIASARYAAPMMFVQRNSCSPAVLAALSTMSVSRVFVPVLPKVDMSEVEKLLHSRSMQFLVLESNLDSHNGDREYLVVELIPEKLIVHLVKPPVGSSSFVDYDDTEDEAGKAAGAGDDTTETVTEDEARTSRRSRTLSSSDAESATEMEMMRHCKYIIGALISSFGEKKEQQLKKLVIPTLDCSILADGRFKRFEPSPLKPVPFETDLFKGYAFFTHKHPATMNPKYQPFYPKHRKVTYEVQVQGRFKRMPEGEIYCGAETIDKMELGFMTKALSNIALKFAAVTVDDLHYSFGEVQTNPDYEFPHLVGPLFPTLDKIVETKDGDPLPELGVPFVEDPAYRKKRLKWVSIKNANLDLTKTYSFSVNTQNIDVVSWQFVNIPMCKPMDLRDFFGDSPLRLVAYELPSSVVKTFKTHPQRFTNYVFNVCLTRVSPDSALSRGESEIDEMELESEDVPGFISDTDDCAFDHEHTAREILGSNNLGNAKPVDWVQSDDDDDEEEEDDGDLDGDGDDDDGEEALNRESHAMVSDREEETEDYKSEDEIDERKVKYRDAGLNTPSKLRRNQYISSTDGSGNGGVQKGYVKNLLSGIASVMPAIIDVPETSGDFKASDYENETSLSLRYCPAIVEVFDYKKKATRVMYVLPFTEHSGADAVPRLRSYDEVTRKLHMMPIPKMHKNKQMVPIEKKRRQIIESYRMSLASTSSRVGDAVRLLLGPLSETDQQFLTHNAKSYSMLSLNPLLAVGARNAEKLWDGSVALALGNRHWIEYYMVITKDGVGISLHQGTKEMWVPLQSMIRAKGMKADEVPFSGFSFLYIETLRKIYYLIVKDAHAQEELLKTLRGLGVTEERTIDKSISVSLDDIFPQLIFKSRMEIWKLQKKKRLYNCRRVYFTTAGVDGACEVAESCLSKALKLAEIWTTRTHSLAAADSKYELIMLWVDFLDELSCLQVVDIGKLSEAERACFFLNVYHTMVIHGSLVLFPPQTRSNWEPFFHDVAYLLSFNVLSIAEIEHNVIKACMAKPPRSALGLGRIRATPKTVFPGFALKHRDFRLNFCINNGSVSMPGSVCIYKAEILDQQLDDMTALAITMALNVDMDKRLVQLPVTCSWFASDFVSSGSVASPTDCLRAVAMYCRLQDREKLDQLLLSGTSPVIKFKPFAFKSRIICAKIEGRG